MEILTYFREPHELLSRDDTLNGGILFGLDGYVIEIQARAMEVLRKPAPWGSVTKISGMPRGTVQEALDRISGAFSKLGVPEPRVSILINLAPADLPKEGTCGWTCRSQSSSCRRPGICQTCPMSGKAILC